jgi:hypothetical protein
MRRRPAFSRPGNDSKRRNGMRRRLLFILGLPMMLAAFVMSAKRHSKSSVRNPEGARADPDKRCVPGPGDDSGGIGELARGRASWMRLGGSSTGVKSPWR